MNASSASASEIVSGALKNHDRAVIVGQTTFGKGTVQLVFPRIAGDAALKLTIAEYLTPGDVSIQGVGVTPDIELDPMTADALEMDLYRSEHRPRERDLTNSLSNGVLRNAERAWTTLRYNLPERKRSEMRERGGDLADDFEMDFPIRFASDLVAKLPPGQRLDELRAVEGFIEKTRNEQVLAISEDLGKMGIDWSAPPKGFKDGPEAGDFEVKVQSDRNGDTVVAGEKMNVKVSVKNNGTSPIYQLRAITKSDGGYYDEKELIFGRIDAGKTKTAQVPLGWCDTEGRKPGSTKPLPLDAKRVCKLPMNAVTRQDVVKVRFSAEGGEPPMEAEFRPTVKSLPQPIFAYTYQVVDDRPGNGDGQVARGEGATVYLTVKNVGKGRSYETQANVSNLTGDGLLLRAGRFDVSNMMPGDAREVAFTFDVLDNLAENLVKMELSVADRELGVVSSEKLAIPVSSGGLSIRPEKGTVTATAKASVRVQPLVESRIVGKLDQGSVLEQLGTFGDFAKVSLGGSRFGFVERKDLRSSGGPQRAKFEPALSRSPPMLEVSPGTLATRDAHVVIEGTATDADQVLDVYTFVGSRKVFYKSNRKSPDPLKMRFSIDVRLTPGINVIHVVARQNEDTATRRTMVVRRDGPNGEALPTPKSELFGADWEFSGDEP
jgi:carboxyl-terminal processing protease